jgi:GDP-4-dehydro-6-deoxy-D-mannose reductase
MSKDAAALETHLMITGQSGFVGSHLLRMLSSQQDRRFSVTERPACDLLEPASIEQTIGDVTPDAVIHLAGQTSVPAAIANPVETLQINLLGTLNLLQILKKKRFHGTFLYISSGDIYGAIAPERMPIDENVTPQPRNPYAVSKIAAEALCLQWSHVEPWRIIVARPFNHIGAGQRPDFVISEIARQITCIRQGRQEPRLTLGDIDVSRDFLDVADVVYAYLALLEKGQNGEIYNVCSGKEFVVRDLIEQMLALAGVEATIERDSKRYRPADQRRVVGNNDKLRAATGWQPRTPLDESLQSILRDWEIREK